MKGRKIFGGKAEGEALVSKEGVSFYGGVDPDTGIVTERGHPLEGQSVSGKILVFPVGKGSTVGSYTIYRLKKNGKAPAAIINKECETVVAVGAIISEIPCVDEIEIEKIKTGDKLKVNADEGIVECVKS
ncbi:MAG: DUF126 domain-containing protein [Candidatus Aenigmarchaeota archaeon]